MDVTIALIRDIEFELSLGANEISLTLPISIYHFQFLLLLQLLQFLLLLQISGQSLAKLTGLQIIVLTITQPNMALTIS